MNILMLKRKMKIDKNFKYTKERFDEAISTRNYLSNFHQLLIPIVDEYNNEYWNSEGYYMAQRTNDLSIKSEISKLSKMGGKYSMSARYKFDLDKDENNRVEYMRKAIKLKFDNNLELKEQLLSIQGEIIEKNYWKDNFFGVTIDSLEGANILGKLLMEYRDANLPKKEFKFFE